MNSLHVTPNCGSCVVLPTLTASHYGDLRETQIYHHWKDKSKDMYSVNHKQ